MKNSNPSPAISACLCKGSLDDEHWVGTWAASPQGPLEQVLPKFNNHTVRQVVHTSIGGNHVRVRLSNIFGTEPLVIGAAHLAVRSLGPDIVPGSDRTLRFYGRSSTSIPAAGQIVSDPVKLDVPEMADLAVSMYLPNGLGVTAHLPAQQTSYISGPGDYTGESHLANELTLKDWKWYALTVVEVTAPKSTGAIVTLGECLTDGALSTPDTNRRWSDILAQRLLQQGCHIAVLNAGIIGNRLLNDGPRVFGPVFGLSTLARFDRDALAQAGVKHVIACVGLGDIAYPGSFGPPSEEVTTTDIIAGLQQLINRAHEKRIQIFGGTLIPFEGAFQKRGNITIYSPQKDLKRQEVNEWIRGGDAFDGVIDIERAVRDPSQPTRILPHYDSGDHIHLNDAGHRAIGEAVDLSLFG